MTAKKEHIALACYGAVFLILLGLQVNGIISRRSEIRRKQDQAKDVADFVSKIRIPTPSMNQGLPADRVYKSWSEALMTEQLVTGDFYPGR